MTDVDASSLDAGRDAQRDAPAIDAGPPEVTCAGTRCAVGESCCFATGACFDPERGSCGDLPDGGAVEGCASNADCSPDSFCGSSDGLCVSAGTCRPRAECDRSGEVCGCDGRTYASQCAAWTAGVRVVGGSLEGPCGSTGVAGGPAHPRSCGDDADCAGGRCCFVTGYCLPEDCPDCCFVPEGGGFPCATDADCSAFADGELFCEGEGCEGPGVCRPAERTCDGLLAPVCGCDGASYSNRCWASHARTRVAHDGACE